MKAGAADTGSLALRVDELEIGQEREALAFLENDPVRHLRMLWALRRYGLFNLGLEEQGRYLVARKAGIIAGMLFLNNQGMLRLAADGDTACILIEQALTVWGLPRVMAGPEEEVENVLSAVDGLSHAIGHREEEVSLALCAADFVPHGGQAEIASEDDLDDLSGLEEMLQTELLGGCAEAWIIRSQVRRSLEEGASALVRRDGRAAAKACIEAATPLVDELGGVYTVPGLRRRGFAAAACSLVCRSSLSGGKKIRLETQRDNASAMGLYARLGFKELWPHLSIRFD